MTKTNSIDTHSHTLRSDQWEVQFFMLAIEWGTSNSRLHCIRSNALKQAVLMMSHCVSRKHERCRNIRQECHHMCVAIGMIVRSIIQGFFFNVVISEMIHRGWASLGNRRHIVSILIKHRCTCNVMPCFMAHTGLCWIFCIMYPFIFCEYSSSGADILPSLLLCRHAASQHETITCIMEGYSCSGDRNSTSHVIWTRNCCALFHCG